MQTSNTSSAHESASDDGRSAVPAVWSRYTNLIIDRGEGSWLIDVEGRRFLDYSSGIGVTSTGHAHPRVVEAVKQQAGRLLHGQQNIVYHQPGLALHQRLAATLPGRPRRVFLANSGAEAIENAVKVARAATGRPVIVTFRGGFHGRTAQAMAMTSSRHSVRTGFEPLPGGIHHVAYPSCGRSGGRRDAAGCCECACGWVDDLERLFAQVVAPSSIAAFVVEPVLGEGGYIVPPTNFLPTLSEIARRHGILLVADEIQTGVGRTGRFWCVEHSGAEPDILVFAKGVASGMPLSGIIAGAALLDVLAPGSLGGTYGGNAVACAAALATLDVIEDEGLVENARERGAQLLSGLQERLADHPLVGDVRGLGLMVAIEFVQSGTAGAGEANAQAAGATLAGALEAGLIVLSAGTAGNVVRLIPPLVTTADEVELAIDILARVVHGLSQVPC
jgi:4-aminobutyrate aminotransferase